MFGENTVEKLNRPGVPAIDALAAIVVNATTLIKPVTALENFINILAFLIAYPASPICIKRARIRAIRQILSNPVVVTGILPAK